MGILAELRQRWFVSMLCIVTALVFVAALGWSTRNYVNVIDARENIALTDADESADLLANDTVELGFKVNLRNPSNYKLTIASVSWSVRLDVSGLGSAQYLPLGSAYKGATEMLVVAVSEVRAFEYRVYISDPAVLATMQDLIDYYAGQGGDYTMENLPYLHDFRVTAWLDEFQHDYQYYGELYLNDMVRLDLGYYEGEYL